MCKTCPPDTYQGDTGATGCKQCPNDSKCFNGKKTKLDVLPPGSIIIWNSENLLVVGHYVMDNMVHQI